MSIAAVVNAGRRLIATAFLDSCAIADRVEVRDSRGGTRATWVNRHKTPPQVVSGGNGTTATVIARDDSGKVLGTWVLPLSQLSHVANDGNVPLSGELSKRAAKEFTASLGGQGVLVTLPMKRHGGDVVITGEFAKTATKRIAGDIAPVGGLRKVVSIHLNGTIGASGKTRKTARIARAGSVAPSGDIVSVSLDPPFSGVFKTQNSILSGTSANFPNPVYYPNPYLTKVIVQNPASNPVALQLGYGSTTNLNPPSGTPSNLPYTIQPGEQWTVQPEDIGKALFMRGASSTSIRVWVISERTIP